MKEHMSDDLTLIQTAAGLREESNASLLSVFQDANGRSSPMEIDTASWCDGSDLESISGFGGNSGSDRYACTERDAVSMSTDRSRI